MLVINYNGNKPTTDYYKYSVQGNNNADAIRFLVSLSQDSLVFNETYHIYAKVQCVDDDFYDKVELSDINFDDSENLLITIFYLESKHTSHKQIEVSLCCEDIRNKIVWQTQIVKVAIANGVNADEEIANTYPTVLAQLQEQIDELAKKEGGGSSEIQIKKIWLSYDEELFKIIRSDYAGMVLDDEEGIEHNMVNDSTKIHINFETTPISPAVKNEVRKGRFVIRLDYPITNKVKFADGFSSTIKSKRTTDCGIGVRGFTYSFTSLSQTTVKKSILLNSLIFVNENDIKVNRYGEEYIHKKISLFDYICRTSKLNHVEYQSITLEKIKSGEGELETFFYEWLHEVFCIGIPHLNENFSGEREKPYWGNAGAKLYTANAPARTSLGSSGRIFNNGRKINPAFNCFTPLLIEGGEDEKFNIIINSPYFNGQKFHVYRKGNSDFYVRYSNFNPVGKKGKINCMVAKPRCAIVNDDYETSDYAFLKTYPQSEQQIKVFCKAIIDTQLDKYVPLFRFHISRK